MNNIKREEVDTVIRMAEKDEIIPSMVLRRLGRDWHRQREALIQVMNELGVPQPGHPMPVANAYEVAQAALKEKGHQ